MIKIKPSISNIPEIIKIEISRDIGFFVLKTILLIADTNP